MIGCILAAQVMRGQIASDSPAAPEALRPPAGQVLLLHLAGKGKQIYTCQSAGGGFAWKLKAPDAQLFDESGAMAGRHFGGPTWEAKDGSRVTGKLAQSVAPADATSIPWLLVNAVSHEGSGVMTRVASIQRLNTKGGKAPDSGCDASSEKAEAPVEYQADYYFYGTAKSE